MLKLDMSKFFPNTHRNSIYEFFKNKLKMSSDVALICTDIVTVNYDKENVLIEDGVYEFLKLKKIKNIIRKHKQNLSKGKTIRYGANEYKKVTGFVISPNNKLVIPNKIKSKIKDQSKYIRKKELDIHRKNSIVGLTNFADISVNGKYRGLRKSLDNIIMMN